MKIKLILSFVMLFAICQVTEAQPKPQDDSAWSVNIGYGIYKIFPTPDGKYLYCNEDDLGRFVKIDALTGQVVDSIEGKGLIAAISQDWKYIYICYNLLKHIKKMDINSYQFIDSVDDMQDINGTYNLNDVKLTPDGQLIIGFYYGKYLLVFLDANNLEIKNKLLTTDYTRGLELIGVVNIDVSPKGDYFVADYGFSGADTVNHQPIPFDWDEDWVWDLKSLNPVKRIFSDSILIDGYRWPLSEFKFSPDGNYFGMVRSDHSRIFNTNGFSLLKEMGISRTLDFDNTNKYLIASEGANLHFFALKDFTDICSQVAYSTLTFDLSTDNRFIYDFSGATGNLTKSKSCIDNVSVKEIIPEKNPIIIFNPTSNILILKELNFEDNIYEYKIINIRGEVVAKDNITIINHQCNLDVKNLLSGVYFLLINNFSFKFSIER
ncbi:MAG: T9SS type A sorting domain-containing protein [FCB group bacterium]